LQNFNPLSIEKDFSENLEILTGTADARILAAFSGGCDSLALVALLSRTIKKENIIAVYVNHHLRSDAELEKELDLNRENCRKLGVKLEVADLGKDAVQDLAKERGNGLEEAARILRYRALEKLAHKNNCPFIATAHHLDDQLETVYMRMLRNSPVTSLRGISEKKKTGSLTLVRPLLEYPKTTLATYLENMGLIWSQDSTNSDNSIERNRIRNIELPRFAEQNPDYVSHILKIRENAVSECSDVDSEETDRVKTSYLKALNPAGRMVVLFGMWGHVVGTLLPQTLIERVNSVLDEYGGEKERQVSANGAVFSFSQDTLFLTAIRDDVMFENFCEKLEENTTEMKLPLGLRLSTEEAADSKTLKIRFADFEGQVFVRFAREGDRITMAGGTKRLSRVLQDMKIPPALRKRVPVIADEKGICAIFGRIYGGSDRLSSRFRLGDEGRATAVPYTCLLQ